MEERTRIFDDQASSHVDGAITPTSSASESVRAVEEDEDELKEKAGVTMTTFNVINSIIGSGIIGLPFAMAEAGAGLGTALLLLVGVASAFSMKTLIVGGSMSNTRSYQELVMVAFGRTGYTLLTIMQACYPFLAMVSYHVIVGDTITKIVERLGSRVVRESVLGYRQFIIFLFALVIALPLSLFRYIASLTKVSLISTVITLLVLVFLIIRAPVYVTLSDISHTWAFANWKIPQAIGIMSAAYMCQHNSFLCYHSLEDRTPHRWAMVVYAAVAFSCVVSAGFGLVGYLTFGALTQGDLFQNYCYTDDLINVARVLFTLTVMATFPIECFVVREVIETTLFVNSAASLMRHVIVTVVIVFTTVAVSMTTDCLGIIFEINGVVNAAPLAFILPPLCVMRLQNEPFLRMKNLPYLATALFGAVALVTGVVLIIVDLAQGVTCSHGKDMTYCFNGNNTRIGKASNLTSRLFHPL